MGTIDPTVKPALVGVTAQWSGLATGDDGAAYATNGKEKSVQVTGTFGGGTVAMQGSNDGTNWVALNDIAVIANPCSFTSTGLKGILQMPKYVRPVVTGGTASAIIVTLFDKI